MYSNLPAPFCCLTKNFIFVGILEDSETTILKNSVLVSKSQSVKWRDHDLWISKLILNPKEEFLDITYIGEVDLEQELCTIIKCSEKWLPLLKVGQLTPVHPQTSSVVTLAPKKKS